MEAVRYEVILDLHKAYDVLDSYRFLDILEVYRVVPWEIWLLQTY